MRLPLLLSSKLQHLTHRPVEWWVESLLPYNYLDIFHVLICFILVLNELTFARKLLNSLMTIFPQTSNIMLMIFVTIFAYAIVGMELFSFLKPSA